MGFFPSLFETLTGRGEMWASAAEGFFMISGMLVGYVYGPRMVRNAWGATKKIWKRALLLYALTILLTFVFVWWGNHSDVQHVKEGLWTQPALGEFLFKTLTLQYYYGWADFLPYYAIFMAWAPLALLAIIRGNAWVVMSISVVGWLLRGNSFELSWQILFMGSMVAGWYLPKIESKAREFAPAMQQRLKLALYAVAIVLVVASALTIRVGEFVVHEYAGFGSLPHAWQSVFLWLDDMRGVMTPMIVKWTLEPVRIVTAVVWFGALYVWMRSHEGWFNRVTRGFFKTWGERSLVVYVMQSFVLFALLQLVPGDHGYLLNSLMSIAIITAVYGLAGGYAYLAKRSRRKVSEGLQRLQLRNEETA